MNENIQYIWVKMSKAINGPHCQCIAKNCDICKQLPRFYKLMRGYKNEKASDLFRNIFAMKLKI
ncbi:MAG: hypothetical protein ACLRQF_01035 [Thomasclavelia ramosa]